MFHYCGILNSIEKILDKVWSTVPDRHAFKLQLNFDGLPLFKSTSTQFWPILGMLQGYTKKPLLIGLFCGTSMPSSLAEYLHDLVQKLKTLKSGFLYKQKTFFVNVLSVVCDSPARAFIRGVKSHNAYHGYDKCHQKGVRKSNRMTFPEVNARRRTNDTFRQAEDEEHHVHHSPLADVGIDMVACFPYDYMHLDVKIHGKLDLISAFPYENFLGKLKRLVRGPCSPLTQVILRLSEMENSDYSPDVKQTQNLKKEHTDGPLPECFSQRVRQFKVLAFDGIVVKAKDRDSCIRIDNKFILVQNIVEDKGTVYIVGNEYKQVKHFLTYPVDSKELGIYVVSNLSSSVKCFTFGKNLQKYVRLPFQNKFVVVPLMHCN